MRRFAPPAPLASPASVHRLWPPGRPGAAVVLATALALVGSGCGSSATPLANHDLGPGGPGGGGGDLAVAGANHQYVATSFLLPTSESDYAYDLNGSGKRRNQLGRILTLLSQEGLTLQPSFDIAIVEGIVSVLFSLQSVDPALRTDPGALLTYFTGKPGTGMLATDKSGNYILDGGCRGCPDFSGAGTFAVQPGTSGAPFPGTLATGHFASDNPATTRHPVTIEVKVSIGPGQDPLTLVINGAHLELDTDTATPGRFGLRSGILVGSVKSSDVDKNVIPAVATLLTQSVQQAPGTPSSKQILAFFDNGHCTNPNGTMAKAKDNVIDPCEVAQSPIIQTVLAPDVQIYDASGNYAPSPQNKNPDSLSVGLGWSAVQASFVQP